MLSKLAQETKSLKNLKRLSDAIAYFYDCGEITKEDLKELNCKIGIRRSILDKDDDQLEIGGL